MQGEFWIYVVQGVAIIAIPVLLFVVMYIGHADYRGLMQKCGFGTREVGLLLVGGLISIILSPLGLFAFPLYIYESSLLAIDLGGALIPVVLSIYLIKIKKPNPVALVLAIAVIGAVTYMTSEFRPPLGIVSEFPYYLFPSFAGIGFALLFYQQRVTDGIPFAYASTTFGVLIGADIVRIPLVMVGLEAAREEYGMPYAAGSIGGAGGLDLVFLAGLIAICPLFFLASREIRHSKAELTPSKAFEISLKEKLARAESLIMAGQFDEAFDSALGAVDMKIEDVGLKFGIRQPPYITLDMLGVHPYLRNDYWLLVNGSKTQNKSYHDAYRALITARTVIKQLEKVETRIYAGRIQRVVAFLIDAVIISIVMFTIFYVGILVNMFGTSGIMDIFMSVWFLAFIMWLWIVQALYFTIFEGWIGQSPGKKLMGITVTTDDYRKCGFMDAFTRNVVRFLDTVLFAYIISLILMSIYPKKQRLGDMVAKTVVLRI